MAQRRKQILFTGYAPVHFVCFLPVYRRLERDARVDVWLSGGFRNETTNAKGEAVRYTLDGFYDPFPVNRRRLLTFKQAQQKAFDVVVCAHTSDAMFPGAVGRSVQIFHGVSFKNLAVREKALAYDLICLPGRYHAELYRKHGLVRPGASQCLITGFPKVDPLAARSRRDSRILRQLGLNPRLPTVLFAPTGEKNNALETRGTEIIRAIRDTRKWNLLIKPHDHPKRRRDWLGELAEFEDERVRLVHDPDIAPVLQASDVLVTDASSAAVEFTLLDRPIVFISVPKLVKRVRRRAPALDLSTYGRKIGFLVRRRDNVASAVARALEHPDRHRRLRRSMAKHVFYRPGDATARVTGVILYAAGLRPRLPDSVVRLRPTESRPAKKR